MVLDSARSYAGEWQSTYGVSAQEVYTDNVCLDDKNGVEEWITTLTPSITLSGNSGRAELELSGALEWNSLEDRKNCSSSLGNAENLSPSFWADGNLEVARNFVFVDASSRIWQNSANGFRASGDTNLNLGGNTNTTYSHTVSPYLVRQVGGAVIVNLRYTYNIQTNTNKTIDDSEESAVLLSLRSVQDGSPFSWTLTGSYREIDYDEQNPRGSGNDILSTVLASVGYEVSPQFRIVGSAGEDLNDFQVVGTDEEVDGSRWSAGFIYNPSKRTKIHVEKGEQFFGDSSTVEIDHHHKHSKLSFKYSESLTLTRDLRLEEAEFLLVDDGGNPFLDQNGEPIYLVQSRVVDTRSPIINESYQLRYTWSRGRTTISLMGGHSRRDELEDATVRDYDFGSIAFEREISPKTTLISRYVYTSTNSVSTDDFFGLGSDYDSVQQNVYLGAYRKLGVQTELSLTLSHAERISDLNTDEYRENRISAGITVEW